MVTTGVILDTNIVIGLLNDNKEIVAKIHDLEQESYELYFSVITKCELISGAKDDSEMQAIAKKYDLFTLDKGMWFAERYRLRVIKLD